MSAQSNLDKMRKYFDLLFGKELEELLSMFADDINWFIVPTNTAINEKAEFRAMARITGPRRPIGLRKCLMYSPLTNMPAWST